MSKDELRALEVDGDDGAVDRTLRETLEPLLGFGRGQNVIVLKDGFNALSGDRKVVAYHLGRLALQRLRGNGYQVETSSEVVATEAQVPKKSCGEYHSRLKREKLLDKNEQGWFVPSYSILRGAAFVARKK